MAAATNFEIGDAKVREKRDDQGPRAGGRRAHAPVVLPLDVNHPPERGKHAFVHHLRQGRVREDGLHEVVLDQLGRSCRSV